MYKYIFFVMLDNDLTNYVQVTENVILILVIEDHLYRCCGQLSRGAMGHVPPMSKVISPILHWYPRVYVGFCLTTLCHIKYD